MPGEPPDLVPAAVKAASTAVKAASTAVKVASTAVKAAPAAVKAAPTAVKAAPTAVKAAPTAVKAASTAGNLARSGAKMHAVVAVVAGADAGPVIAASLRRLGVGGKRRNGSQSRHAQH
jgi:hypothetical protein